MIKIELQEIRPGRFEAIATTGETEVCFVADDRESLPVFVSRVYLALNQRIVDRPRMEPVKQ